MYQLQHHRIKTPVRRRWQEKEKKNPKKCRQFRGSPLFPAGMCDKLICGVSRFLLRGKDLFG